MSARSGPVAARLGALKRWLYRGGRPGRVMRWVNRRDARLYASPLAPRRAAVLEVVARRSQRVVTLPVAVADLAGEEYLVSMLGDEAAWVRNVRAAGGRATLRRRGRREEVRLEEVPPERRAPILRRYLEIAPGARPHIPVDRRAPVAAFEPIADRHPVFRILK